MSERPLFRYTMDGFRAFNEPAQEFADRCKLGDVVELKATRVRNGKFHRLFFAILKLISDNSEPHITTDEALFYAKIGAGCGKWLEAPSGMDLFVPGSIAFAKMDQPAFDEFVKKAIPPLCVRFMNGSAPEDVIAEAMSLAA